MFSMNDTVLWSRRFAHGMIKIEPVCSFVINPIRCSYVETDLCFVNVLVHNSFCVLIWNRAAVFLQVSFINTNKKFKCVEYSLSKYVSSML